MSRADIAELPRQLDRIDAWIGDGLLGGAQPNAADLQIGSTIQLLLTLGDVRPLLAGSPAASWPASSRRWSAKSRPACCRPSGSRRRREPPSRAARPLQSATRHARATVADSLETRSAAMRILDPQSLTKHVDRLYRAAWALCGSARRRGSRAGDLRAVLAAAHAAQRRRAAYLMGVLRNTFLRAGRRRAGRRPSRRSRTRRRRPRPMGRPEQAIDAQDVYATIAELPDDFRLALVAVDVLGLSYREAARALGVREATITSRLLRARKQVAERLSDETAPRHAARRAAGRRDSRATARLRGNECAPAESLREERTDDRAPSDNRGRAGRADPLDRRARSRVAAPPHRRDDRRQAGARRRARRGALRRWRHALLRPGAAAGRHRRDRRRRHRARARRQPQRRLVDAQRARRLGPDTARRHSRGARREQLQPSRTDGLGRRRQVPLLGRALRMALDRRAHRHRRRAHRHDRVLRQPPRTARRLCDRRRPRADADERRRRLDARRHALPPAHGQRRGRRHVDARRTPVRRQRRGVSGDRLLALASWDEHRSVAS